MSQPLSNHSFELQDGVLHLKGTFRLKLPAAYSPILDPLRERINNNETPILNIKEVSFFNSSGIVAIASIILKARDKGLPMIIYYDKDKLALKRSIVSLEKLWEKLETKGI